MPWYWCSNLYEWGNYVKAKRCRRLREYDEEWLERHIDETGVISRPPFCQVCGHQSEKPEYMKECPHCKEDDWWS